MNVLTYEQLKQRLDAVVAEFAAFKSAHPQPFGPVMMQALDAYEKHQDDVPETGMLNAFFILRDSIVVETPNVTSALAEVEVKAIEKLIVWATASSGFDYDLTIEDAQRFADELREAQ